MNLLVRRIDTNNRSEINDIRTAYIIILIPG